MEGSEVIEYTKGNILESDAEVIVNPVNCVGVMGRGLALQVKLKWPAVFVDYASACKKGWVTPGRMYVNHTGSAESLEQCARYYRQRRTKMLKSAVALWLFCGTPAEAAAEAKILAPIVASSIIYDLDDEMSCVAAIPKPQYEGLDPGYELPNELDETGGP